MLFLKKAAISILVAILLSMPALAYNIPAEYRDQARNEVEVYILASTHESEAWASAIIYDQICQNVGCNYINGKEKLNKQMEYYMKFYIPKMPDVSLP